MKVLLMALTSLLLLILVEISLGLLPQTREERIYQIIRMDSELLWKVKANFSSDFFGGTTTTNENGFREIPHNSCDGKHPIIWLMGASPAFGWGVDDDKSYAALLAHEYCVRNFSVIGYSSGQGIKLFATLLEKETPDVVLVTYLVNDIDFLRFYFASRDSDQQELTKKRHKLFVHLSDFIAHLNLKRLADRISSVTGLNHEINFTRYWAHAPRTTLEEYEKNLQQFVNLLANKKSRLLFIRTPDSFPRQNHDECPNSLAAPLLREIHEAIKQHNFEDVLSKTNAMLIQCPYHFEARSLNFYAKMKLHFPENDQEDSKKLLFQAAALNAGQRINDYQAVMKKVALKAGISFINIDEAFKKNPDLFCHDASQDFVHPNELGHSFFFQLLKNYVK